MAARSRGRGTAAAIGLFLLFAGLVGGGVLYTVSQRRPSQTVDGFARAAIGCTTTLEFSEVGTFYVFEESGLDTRPPDDACQPVATPAADFAVEFTGDLEPESLIPDTTISYDIDGFDGRSVQRVEISEPGEYAIAVTGGDLTVVAALGRDPTEGIDDLRRTALVVAIVGTVLGLGLLTLAGRRSKQAAVLTMPDGPGWGPAQPRPTGEWPPAAPSVRQVPVNPHQPMEPARAVTPPPLPEREPTVAADWPAPTGEAVSLPPPERSRRPFRPPPGIEPTLPESPGPTPET